MNNALVEAVSAHVDYARKIYISREWMNVRSALAHLVANARSEHPSQIRLALASLETQDHLKPTYRRWVWARWRRFYRWGVEFGFFNAQDLFTIETFRPRFKNTEKTSIKRTPELNQIVVGSKKLNQIDRDLVHLLLLTGARPSELLNITAAHVEYEPGAYVVELEHHKTAHHNHQRRLIFAGPARNIIERHLRPFAPLDWLFPAPKNPTKPVSTQTIAQRLRRRGVNFTLYDCRRVAAQLVRKHAALDVAQALLGHANASTTEMYAPVDHEAARIGAGVLAEQMENLR